jgi:Planctomycete cytochrome C/Ankyrin repeats (3 copies)
MTHLRLPALTVLLAALSAASFTAQTPSRVDFGRDVQPILRDQCYACHGPEQQMNGLRLDRRADAMRGGTQSVIGPGNAEGSRLYHRLIGTSVGSRMPPTGPLDSEKVAVIKAWIDQGADWPDDLAGIAVSLPVDPDAERLAGFIRSGNRTAIDGVLRKNPKAAVARTKGGSTPLMFAALYGDTTLVKRLIELGAEAGVANVAGATPLMWASPNVDKMRLLLDAGANADARSDDRRTAIVTAAGMVGAAPAVTLLLEYGANPSPLTTSDPSPLREAARINSADTFQVLLDYGADTGRVPATFLRATCFACATALGVGGDGPLDRIAPPDTGLRSSIPASASKTAPLVSVASATPAAIHAAVERSLPLLQRVDVPFIRKTGCVSCHHNSLVSFAVSLARRGGYRVDEQQVGQQRAIVANYLESWRERTTQNMFIAGQQDTISYLLFGLAASGHSSDGATDAQVQWLLRRQSPDGHWPLGTLRPPIESNDVEVTALSMRDLQLYAPAPLRPEYDKAVARARDWLASAKAATTEERAFRLMGLSWAQAKPAAVAAAARELASGQHGDGGWSQEPAMAADAYATGQALVALLESGAVSRSDAVVRRGVEFLLRTQHEDGSWFVKSHAVPIQAYFESGFPYGGDQWVSSAATAWATAALAWKPLEAKPAVPARTPASPVSR